MKKNYFLLAATTMMFAACAQTDLVNEVVTEEAPQAIGFETFANKQTRAEITDTVALHNVGFAVWGYKTYNSGTPTTVFDEVEVSYNSTNNYWTYTDKKYWDETAIYDFYAVAPYDKDATSIENGKITIANVASGKSSASKDYLIDRDGNTEVEGSAKTVVPFDFNHTMAKLSFELKAGVSEKITVKSLTMTGWDNAEGTFVQQYTSTPTNNSHEEWTLETPKVPGEAVLVGSGATDDTSIELPADKTTKNVQDTYIMVPQTIAANALTFTITYEINGETFTAQTGTINTEQVWGTDTHTTYTITVAPHIIDFTVNSVKGWTTDLTGSTTIE